MNSAVVRRNVIDLLFRMYEQAGSEREKREVIQALNEAMRFPASAAYGDALAKMVLDDTRRIVEFFADPRRRSSLKSFNRWSSICFGCIAVRKTKLALNRKSAPKLPPSRRGC